MVSFLNQTEKSIAFPTLLGYAVLLYLCIYISLRAFSSLNAAARSAAPNTALPATIMSAPAWQEDQHSPFLQLTSDTFFDVLGWRPRMVAMHFVLEAGFFVQHYPGIQMASIGPRIVEPHSASERVEMKTIDDIWQVLLELLRRLK